MHLAHRRLITHAHEAQTRRANKGRFTTHRGLSEALKHRGLAALRRHLDRTGSRHYWAE